MASLEQTARSKASTLRRRRPRLLASASSRRIHSIFGRQVDIKYPEHVSQGARDLINKLLVKDPAKRLALTEVEHDPWIRKHTAA